MTESGPILRELAELPPPRYRGGGSLKRAARGVPRSRRASGHAGRVVVTAEGVRFRSYRDGSPLFLSPESSVGAQKALGADIIIPLDELPPADTQHAALSASLDRTHRWEARSLRAHLNDPREQAMYAVIHGGTDRQLRASSARYLSSLPFDGWAVGGSLGRHRSELGPLLAHLLPLLPRRRPVHLLGIGDAESVGDTVSLGVDTYDSCFPTRLGRHGTLLTRGGKLRIGRACHRDEYAPIDEACDGYVSTTYSRAYLHHLWRAREPAVHALCALHNIKFMMDYMAGLRRRIIAGEI